MGERLEIKVVRFAFWTLIITLMNAVCEYGPFAGQRAEGHSTHLAEGERLEIKQIRCTFRAFVRDHDGDRIGGPIVIAFPLVCAGIIDALDLEAHAAHATQANIQNSALQLISGDSLSQ